MVKLTEFSHGAGCGCKIAPSVLKKILQSQLSFEDPKLLVGNETADDAAVYDLGNGQALVSTTDFFMPIVDDPFTFGKIAATNAISDIYAMGGKPIMAIAILGWPVDKLDPKIAQQVIEGGRSVCHQAGISLAGGHSIDNPEPIFGLAVTGVTPTHLVKRNSSASAGCQLFLSKPLGVGILTTAQKKNILTQQDQGVAEAVMCQLNQLGQTIASFDGVEAMTDVTGFGLFGHLLEICQGSKVSAEIFMSKVPLIKQAEAYRQVGAIPGGTFRNFESYRDKISELSEWQRDYGCDPQTSGGLLIAVRPDKASAFQLKLANLGYSLEPFGQLIPAKPKALFVYD